MAILLKTASVRVSSIQIIQVRVHNKGKSVWKSRYDGDVSVPDLSVLRSDVLGDKQYNLGAIVARRLHNNHIHVVSLVEFMQLV